MLPFKWYREIDRAKSSQYFNTVLLVSFTKAVRKGLMSLFWTQRKIFWRMWAVLRYSIFISTMEVNGAQNSLITNFLQNIFLCVQIKHIHTGLNDLRVSKWQNFHFWVNYPFKVLFWTPLTFNSMYGQKQLKHSSKHFIKICVYVLMHFWLNIHLEVINFH